MTRKKIDLNLHEIIALSLLLCSSYYFFNDQFFEIDHFILKEDYIVLFLFLNFIFFILKKINTLALKLNSSIYNLIICFFHTWILVQIIKGFFFLSNIITLPQFIGKIFSWSEFYNNDLYYRLFIFLLPYIICFFIVFFYKKNILRLFVIVGYVFFITVIFREVKGLSLFAKEKMPSIEFEYELEEKKIINKNRKVLWIVFDGFDYEIAFDQNDRSSEFMKNFKELKKHSFFHSQMFTPGKNTITALPYMLVGIKGPGNFVKDDTLMLKSELENEKSIEFNFQNTIFGRLKKIDFTSSAFSSVLPYCIYLSESAFTECKDYRLRNYVRRKSRLFLDGVLFIFPIIDKYKTFFEVANNEKISEDKNYDLEQIRLIKELKPKIKLESINDLDNQNVVFFDDIINSLEKNTNLTFVHTWYPHLGNKEEQKFIERIFDLKNSSKMTPLPSYILNLKYTDFLLNKIMSTLGNYTDDEILLVLSSDHWARSLKKTNNLDLYPVVFFAKILNDKTKSSSIEKTNSIYVQELVYKYLTKEISNHNQIKKFFEEKNSDNSYTIK